MLKRLPRGPPTNEVEMNTKVLLALILFFGAAVLIFFVQPVRDTTRGEQRSAPAANEKPPVIQEKLTEPTP